MMTLLCLAAILEACPEASAQGASPEGWTDSLLVVFWNTENFFENSVGFRAKCQGISKIIFRIADECGRFPDAIGFAEVENEAVLRKLVGLTALRKVGYGIVHYDSPDHRGIDCALLYRKATLRPIASEPKHLYAPDGTVLPTRDILLARFDSLAILVNHHPSKVGEDSDDRRSVAMQRLREVCDSLDGLPWLAVGDFNEDIWRDADAHGTIKYNGRWEKIDGHLNSANLRCDERVFAFPELLERDKAYGGMKPRRTSVGPRYNRGLSDHLPIGVLIYF